MIEHVPKIIDMRVTRCWSRVAGRIPAAVRQPEAAATRGASALDQANWAQGLERRASILGQDVTVDEIDVLYWVGCAGRMTSATRRWRAGRPGQTAGSASRSSGRRRPARAIRPPIGNEPVQIWRARTWRR
jgi:hypothetical protein